MKRFFCLILCAFVIPVYAAGLSFWDDSFVFSAGQDVSYHILNDTDLNSFSSETVFSLKMPNFETEAGVAFSQTRFDLMASLLYGIKVSDSFKFGPRIIYHFENYFEPNFFENDVMAGLFAEWNFFKCVDFRFSAFYFQKMSDIPSVSAPFPTITNYSMGAFLELGYTPVSVLRIYASFKTQMPFDYPLFVTPFYNIGFEYSPVKRFSINLEYSAKWVDCFTISAALTEQKISLAAKFNLEGAF